MQELSPQQIRKLKKLAKVVDEGNIAILEHLFEIEEKIPDIDKILSSVRGKDGDDGEKGEKGDKGDRGERGDKGIDGKDGRDGRDGRDGIDGVDGKDGKDGKMGMIDEATIAYLEDKIKQIEERQPTQQGRVGWGAHPLIVKDGVTTIDKVTRVISFGNNLTATRSADGTVTVNATAGSGVTVETPTGSVNGSNASFTVSDVPKWVVADGITYFDGAGYTYGALTITMDVAPSQYIRAII